MTLNRRVFLSLATQGVALALIPIRPAFASGDLILGEYALDPDRPVVDGDTIKVLGLDSSLRLIGIDTEETFKATQDRKDAKQNFAAYCKKKRGDKALPTKYGTPAGELASTYASSWFRGVTRVRLEYDEAERRIDIYGRHLVHIFGLKQGRWRHYNVACVRDGWSPYFNKYGESRRYHDAFVDAQKAARAEELGIWSKDVDHYPDYNERLPWWDRRAQQINHFEAHHANDPMYVRLGEGTAFDRLMAAEGQRRIVFGVMSTSSPPKGLPYRRYFGHMNRQNFTVVSFNEQPMQRLKLEDHLGEYVYLEGVVSSYRGLPQFQAEGVRRVWREPEEL